MIKFLFLVLLTAGALFAQIDGTVTNQTTGKTQGNVEITLLKPSGSGMQNQGSTKTDRFGNFKFASEGPRGGPLLLQAHYLGVNYNKLLTPAAQTRDIKLDIFESVKSAAVARVAQHMLILQPSANDMTVNETVILENGSKTTFNNSQTGGFQFFLPPEAGAKARVSAQGTGGMPLPQVPQKTNIDGVMKIVFPVKPGQTQFDINYSLPTGSPVAFHGRAVAIAGMQPGPLRLVAPQGVTLAGDGVKSVGQEPNTKATVYDVASANNFTVQVTGNGSLSSTAEGAATAQSDNDSPQVIEGTPIVYQHLGWLVALTFAILGVGMTILFRASPVRPR